MRDAPHVLDALRELVSRVTNQGVSAFYAACQRGMFAMAERLHDLAVVPEHRAEFFEVIVPLRRLNVRRHLVGLSLIHI